jgi:hypothetical protein
VTGVTVLGIPLPLDLVEQVGNPAGRPGESVLVQRFALPGGIQRATLHGELMVIHGHDS